MLLIGSGLVQAVTFVVRPTVTYRAIELGVSPGLLGIIGASFAVVPLLLALPAGRLVDRFGEVHMLRGGAALCVVATLALALVGDDVAVLIAATGLLGAGHLGCVVGQQALVANETSPGRLDSTFGYYTFAASLGQTLGPGIVIIFGSRAPTPDTSAIFAVSALLAVGLLISALRTRQPRGAASGHQPGRDTAGTRKLLRTPGLFAALFTSSVILSAIDITVIYLPALGAERGLSGAAVGTLLAVRGLGSMAARLGLGWISSRLGRTRLMLVSIVLSASALALLAIPMPIEILVAVIAIGGVGLGVGQPLTMSWLTAQAPVGQRGMAMSLRLTGNRVGQTLLPAGVGVLAAGAGAAGVLVATATLVASTALFLRRTNLDDAS